MTERLTIAFIGGKNAVFHGEVATAMHGEIMEADQRNQQMTGAVELITGETHYLIMKNITRISYYKGGLIQ